MLHNDTAAVLLILAILAAFTGWVEYLKWKERHRDEEDV